MLQIISSDMASKVLVDPSDVSCSVCLDIFTDPRVLRCAHSFCYGCLKGWVNKSGSSQTMTCSICRDISPIPSGGLKKVKDSKFLADLVDKMRKMDLISTHGEFEFIKENMSVGKTPYIYCQFHARNIIDQYCVDCGLAACGTCLLRDHRHHKLVDLEEQAAISKQQLQGIIQQVDLFIELIEKEINESRKFDEQSTIDIESIIAKINQINIIIERINSKLNSRIISKLNHQKQQLFSSLETIQEQKENEMMTVREGQDVSIAALTSLRSYASNLLSHGRDYDRVQQAVDMQSRLVSICRVRIPSFVWWRSDTFTVEQPSIFRSIWGLHDVTEKQPSTPSSYWGRHDDKEASSNNDRIVQNVSFLTDRMVREAGTGSVSISDNVINKIPLTNQGSVTGLEVMGQTVWVIYDKKSFLYAYPVTSPHQPQELSIPGLSHPADMMKFPSGQSQLVISNFDKL